MDRGGGSGRGGPSRQGSSLPRTLHGSLLPGGHEAQGPNVFTEQPQPLEASESGQEEHPPPAAAYATSSARSASVSYSSAPAPGPPPLPTFEQGSSRGPPDPPRAYTYPYETQAAHQPPPLPPPHALAARQPLPPLRAGFAQGRADHAQYASSLSSRLYYDYPPPAPPPPPPPAGRPSLPPLSTLDPALAQHYAGAASQAHAPARGSDWGTPPGPYVPARPVARPPWPYAALPAPRPPSRAYAGHAPPLGYPGAARWEPYGAAEGFAQDEGRSSSTAAHRECFSRCLRARDAGG